MIPERIFVGIVTVEGNPTLVVAEKSELTAQKKVIEELHKQCGDGNVCGTRGNSWELTGDFATDWKSAEIALDAYPGLIITYEISLVTIGME